jgi:hypothetical protein
MRAFSAHREMPKNAALQPQKYALSSTTSPAFGTKVLLLLAFLQPLGLMILAAILHKNVILYRTIFLVIPPFIMWMVYTLVPASPNIMHKVIWGVSAVIIIAGLATWTPKQQGGNLDEFAQFVEKHFQSGDAFYHNNGLSAIVFNYYFPDKPNYLMSAQGLLGEADLYATKIEPVRYEPSRVPAERVWVVWAHHVDLERINHEADIKTSNMVTDCPLVSVLHYPQSWDNEIYLCEMEKP